MNEEDDILLSRYLAGELPEREKRAVEQRLSADEGLAAELALRQQETVFLRTEADLPNLREKMARLSGKHFNVGFEARPEEEAKSEKHGKPSTTQAAGKVRKLSWWRYAASGAVAAVLVLAVWWFTPFGNQDPYRQYAQYEELSLTEKSSGGAIPTAAAAEEAFNAENYEQAFNLLTTYLRDQPDDNQARLALGIAALETGRQQEAIRIFTALANGSTSYRDDGQFYLGYTLLRNGDPAGRAELEKIAPNNPDFGVRSRALLQLEE